MDTTLALQSGRRARIRWQAKETAPATILRPAAEASLVLPPAILSRLYFAIEAARTGDAPLIVQFAGPCGGEGTSTVAAGYARQAARQSGLGVLLATCAPAAWPGEFGAAASPGLLDMFRAGRPLAEVATRIDGGDTGRGSVLWARLGDRAGQDVDMPLLRAFAVALRAAFPLVVLDCPPVCATPVASVMSGVADGTVLVAEAGRTQRRALDHAAADIAGLGGQVIGLVLNRQRVWLPAWLRRQGS